MRKNRDSVAVDYFPCVLKLERGKFVGYVERRVNGVRPPNLPPAALAVFAKRKHARRAARAMARHQQCASRSSDE